MSTSFTKADSLVRPKNTINKFKNFVVNDKTGNLRFRSPFKPLSPARRRAFSWMFLAVVVLEASWIYVQSIQIFRTKSADDVSLPAVIIVTFTNFIWICYALFVINELPILVSAVLLFIGAIIALVGKLTYG